MTLLIVSSAVFLPVVLLLALLLAPHHGALPGFSSPVKLVDSPLVPLEVAPGCEPLWLGAQVADVWLGVALDVLPVI